MKFNVRFSKSFIKFVKAIKDTKTKRQVAKICGKYLQPLLEYIDDDGLNFFDEDTNLNWGYILNDKEFAKVVNRKRVFKNYVYQADILEEPSKDNNYVTTYRVALPTKKYILNVLNDFLFLVSKSVWRDNSKLSNKQYKIMRASIQL